MLFELSRLWKLCILLVVCLFIYRFTGCKGSQVRLADNTHQVPMPKKPAASATMTPDDPSYTYVGEIAATSVESPKPAAVNAIPKSNDRITRQTEVDTTTGMIPDLDIRLAGNDILEVMEHYGYIPAVTTRTKLLGKIDDDRFVPLAESDFAGFAARGRAGDAYPDAGRWKDRIAREFSIPEAEVQVVFLVPRNIEAFFIDIEHQALARLARHGSEVSLIRAHFGRDLRVIVDEVVTRSGAVLPVDSVEAVLPHLD